MTPDFTWFFLSGVLFGLAVLGFIRWRFGGPDTLAFLVVAGLFPALMDFLSSFGAQNYVYPGQSRVWVFTYVFFGWMAVCGTCMLLAEGILARPDADLLTDRPLWWKAPLATAIIAVLLDLFIDPIAVAVGYWKWLIPSELYYGIPMLNFVGWFVLMLLSPLAWILIARREGSYARKGTIAAAALLPLCAAAIVLSAVLNTGVAALGLR
ncbi:MAG: carotenoid biosynthesis protein [Gammaproteobacteria bacterium]|nr:carotenoid biosynthesis protein [Gammaproteobacteria bacterium]NIR81748.1 carotenoid biosynthesis protein [Gammaproteobacteria bacterium]NIR88551.1 carotenoid biosynthesis protein [Gammaproteobacteria bacterium]NIU02855.1 carotenoid biosynthesis protein [Gammaproteobacteria bacterium]NIV50377.1 carotenoid biosynthesis protein [Gammaproteobacteria bacterium]